jgi:hypothetical protein
MAAMLNANMKLERIAYRIQAISKATRCRASKPRVTTEEKLHC